MRRSAWTRWARVKTRASPQKQVDEVSYPTTSENAVFCAGLNYEAHAEESDTAVPERPLIFTKLPRTLVGHQVSISYHIRVTQEVVWAVTGGSSGYPAYGMSNSWYRGIGAYCGRFGEEKRRQCQPA